MGNSFHFDDSELAGIDAIGDLLVLRFSAAHLQRDGDSSAGHAAGLRATFGRAAWAGDPLRDCVGRLLCGRLTIDGLVLKPLRLPIDHAGTVRLELDFANRSQLTVDATSIRIAFDGDPHFSESLAC